ncbi:acetyltransferase [Ignicoccus islandicus DSM 13165]|uniref:Acetyltransferase n=2 Tax=Ignicoccus islandicus TaxID=54259 RepID=A0A0U3F6J6_9CREN|nr:acetyltransferase [Ignicoccus islandicus DSM 13165]
MTVVERGIVVRRATREDLPAVVAINRRELPENYPYSFFEWVLYKNPDLFLVAELNGEIVGYLMAERGVITCPIDVAHRLGIPHDSVIHLLSIAVKREYQGRGIGSKLLGALIDHCSKGSITSEEVFRIICLEVRVSNTRAQNLYKKFGFEIFTTLKFYYMDGEDAYLMIRKCF